MSGRSCMVGLCRLVRSRVAIAALMLVPIAGEPRAASAEPAVSSGEIEALPLEMERGEQRVIPTDGVRSYSEGTPGIVDVRLTKDGRQFVVVGRGAGTTSLLLMLERGGERLYRITVRDSSGAARRDETDPDRVAARDNVRLDFYFVELRSSENLRAGVNWPSSFGGGNLTASFDLLRGSPTGASAVVADQALPRLDLAQARGYAKVLRQAAVITASGTEAKFSGGGEVNIPVQGTLAAEIRSIEFGSTVKVLPRYDRESGRLELAITAEVSDLTEDAGTGAPGRSVSDLQTVVNLEPGQSLVVGGLTARSESRTRAGLPLLSQVPILGLLFGTSTHRKQDTESVVLIVPSIVAPVSALSRERIEEALRAFEEYEGKAGPSPLVPEAAPWTAKGSKP